MRVKKMLSETKFLVRPFARKMVLQKLVAAAVLCFALPAAATSFSLNPIGTSNGLSVNDTVSFDLLLNTTGDEVFDGGVDIFWDPSIFQLSNVEANPLAADLVFPPEFPGNPPGELLGFEFANFADPLPIMDSVSLGFLIFDVIGTIPSLGSTILTAESIGLGDAFGDEIAGVDYFGTTVTGVVPIPAGIWLFITAISGLVGSRVLRANAR